MRESCEALSVIPCRGVNKQKGFLREQAQLSKEKKKTQTWVEKSEQDVEWKKIKSEN